MQQLPLRSRPLLMGALHAPAGLVAIAQVSYSHDVSSKKGGLFALFAPGRMQQPACCTVTAMAHLSTSTPITPFPPFFLH